VQTFVYMASDRPLLMIPWDESAPGLHVNKLTAEEMAVKRHFTKRFVYFVGSHDGSGDGFSYDKSADDKDPARESVRKLRSYLATAVKRGPVEVYSFRIEKGGVGPALKAKPHRWLTVTPSYFGGDSFEFRNKEMLVVIKDTGGGGR
jgi:hypothetical protein